MVNTYSINTYLVRYLELVPHKGVLTCGYVFCIQHVSPNPSVLIPDLC
jgi:hypothetical protein